jgi:hypothetical protein
MEVHYPLCPARMKRVMDEERLSARQTEHRIRESDREAQARVRKMLGVDVEDSQFYDAVLNPTSSELADHPKRRLPHVTGPCCAHGSSEGWARADRG